LLPALQLAVKRKGNRHSYPVVLTKTDKPTDKALHQTEKDFREFTKKLADTLRLTSVPGEPTEADLAAAAASMTIPILKTSSFERVWRDDVWKDVLTKKRW
jgi:hypothetical protein